MENQKTTQDEQVQSTWWCLKHAKTEMAAQMPKPGVLLCFESVQDAELFKALVIGDGSPWKPNRICSSDLASHRGVAVWDQKRRDSYLVADLLPI